MSRTALGTGGGARTATVDRRNITQWLARMLAVVGNHPSQVQFFLLLCAHALQASRLLLSWWWCSGELRHDSKSSQPALPRGLDPATPARLSTWGSRRRLKRYCTPLLLGIRTPVSSSRRHHDRANSLTRLGRQAPRSLAMLQQAQAIAVRRRARFSIRRVEKDLTPCRCARRAGHSARGPGPARSQGGKSGACQKRPESPIISMVGGEHQAFMPSAFQRAHKRPDTVLISETRPRY